MKDFTTIALPQDMASPIYLLEYFDLPIPSPSLS